MSAVCCCAWPQTADYAAQSAGSPMHGTPLNSSQKEKGGVMTTMEPTRSG